MDDETRADVERQPAAEDELAPLLRLAGRRPRLPEEEVAPIRATALEVFRRQARRAARMHRLGWAAASGLAATLLLVAALALRSSSGPASRAPVARFERWTGEVSVTGGGDRLSADQTLSAGAVLSTGDGRAAVRLAGGASLRIDAGSAVRFDSARLVTLERGAAYLDSGSTAAGAIEVATVFGSVRDVGTQFETRLLPGGIRVRVREGRVLVEGAGESREAHAGGELTLWSDGRFERAEIPVYGPGWDWVQRAAPAFAIDGASLADFLAWVSRETGLRWRLAEPAAGKTPGEIVLHGSIEGLTPEQALAVVLPSCGYKHRRVGDQLWLERLEAEASRDSVLPP